MINKNMQPNSESLIHPASTEAFPRQITKGTHCIFISRVIYPSIQDYSLSGTHPVFAKFVQYVITTALSMTSFLEKLQGNNSVGPIMGIPST